MQWLKSLLGMTGQHDHLFAPVPPSPAQDALAAIDHLSRAMKQHHGAIEICSALGNLYRLRGELDRAIQMRSSLLKREDLTREDETRILFELGRDYSRAGILDRAKEALEQCREKGGGSPELDLELAWLLSKSGEYLQASRQYKKMELMPQAAHYLVRAATGRDGRTDQGLLSEARELYPASPEAWLESVVLCIGQDRWPEVVTMLDQGLTAVGSRLGFVLLDPFFERDESGVPSGAIVPAEYLDEILVIIRRQPQSLTLTHYAGCLLRAHGRIEEATTWQEKSLLLNPGFWPARLELLTMALPDQTLTPVFELQLDFLLRRARQVKRFVCGQCGLKRSQIFFCCPRCLSWHSITFRQLLTD
jgi:tetratricopeptide (TPR) repeat protein